MPLHEQEELLFIGDVHLGRRPVGLDTQLEQLGLKAGDLSPVAALERTVEAAVASPPRAVVFAGDLVDQDEDGFEALWVLERAANKLKAAGIPVVAIAGNHDGRVLPRLIERVPGVKLLGANATWERIGIPGPGRPVDLFGWSFPGNHFADNPLDHGDFAAALGSARTGAARLGVLHADLDAGSSNYAPVSTARLDDAGLDAWFLGHVHKPSPLDDAQPIGYLGSLVGLDAGESGPRGAWRVRATDTGVEARQLALGPVRFENIEVCLDAAACNDVLTDDFAVRACIEAALAEHVASAQLAHHHRALVARVRLTGALEDRAAVQQFSRSMAQHPIVFDAALPTILQRVTDETREPVDLQQLAAEPTPIGHIARELLAFQATGAVAPEVRAAFASTLDGGWPLDEDTDPAPALDALFERAAWQALATLLSQEREPRA